MKKWIKYYLFMERSAITLFLIMVYVALLVVAILTVQSIGDITESVFHYYHVRDKDQETCTESQRSSDTPYHRYEWRDNTFWGLGQEGSYGCFLIIETPQTKRKGNER